MNRILVFLLLAFAFANADVSETCQKLMSEGWCFIVPTPKSPQANYGNYDRRTTWWSGYWKNDSAGECSQSVPRYVPKHDIVVGDGKNCRAAQNSYRNGGYIPISSLENECLCKEKE